MNHGGSWTVGVPLAMAEGHLQADWEEIPTSFAQHIAQMVPEECPTVRLTRHKADEFHLGATVFYSQTCRSWRSEVQILDPGGNILLTSYWGMGLHRQSKYIYGLVLRISSRTVLESSNSWTMESHCCSVLFLSRVFKSYRARVGPIYILGMFPMLFSGVSRTNMKYFKKYHD